MQEVKIGGEPPVYNPLLFISCAVIGTDAAFIPYIDSPASVRIFKNTVLKVCSSDGRSEKTGIRFRNIAFINQFHVLIINVKQLVGFLLEKIYIIGIIDIQILTV